MGTRGVGSLLHNEGCEALHLTGRRLSPLGPLAQSVEQRTFNPWVVGSIPTGPTIYLRQEAEDSLPKRFSTGDKFTLAALSFYLIAIGRSYSLYAQGDFAIYFRAAKRVALGQPLYDFEKNLYVYGPFLAHLLSPLSFLSELEASRIWLLINLLLAPLIALLIWKIFQESSVKSNALSFILTFIMTSFSFRNNAGNGSVMSIVTAGSLILLAIIKVQRKTASRSKFLNTFFYDLIAASILVFIFEVKTYLAIWLLLFVGIFRLRLVFLAFFISASENIFLHLANQENYLNWINEIIRRSQSVKSGDDQATLLTLIHRLLNPFISWDLAVSVLLYCLIGIYICKVLIKVRNSENLEHSFLLVISAAVILTPFAHGQDFLFSVTAILAILIKGISNLQISYLVVIASALLVNWTNSSFLMGQATICLLYYTLGAGLEISKKNLIFSFLLAEASLVLNYLVGKKDLQQQYIFYNMSALAFGLVVLLAVARTRHASPKEA